MPILEKSASSTALANGDVHSGPDNEDLTAINNGRPPMTTGHHINEVSQSILNNSFNLVLFLSFDEVVKIIVILSGLVWTF